MSAREDRFHRIVLSTAIVCGAILAASSASRAEIVVGGDTIEFHGNFRAPGQPDQPRVVTVNERAFAAEANAVPPCVAPDDCFTQLQSTGLPISVEDALTGYSPRTSYRYAGGDLVLTFGDILPANDSGPDLAVFEGFSQSGFAIKVRTRDGAEYGFTDVPAEPFFQISNGNWGPCFTGRVLDGCTFFGLLLAYEIELDDLGVPAGAVVEEVTIRKKQVPDPFGDVPNLVMIAGINTFDAIPRFSSYIKNGRFADGLAYWTTTGGGSVELGSDSATLHAPGTAVAITQTIDTPNESFQIIFDRKFLTSAGRLVLSLNGQQLFDLAAPVPLEGFKRETVYVNDVALMGLQDAELKLELFPGSDALLLVTNVGIPENDIGLIPHVKFSDFAAHTEFVDCRPNTVDECVDPKRAYDLEEAEDIDPAGPGDRAEAVSDEQISGSESVFADVYAEVLALTGAVKFGVGAVVADDFPPCLSCPGYGGYAHDLEADTDYGWIQVTYRVEADPDGGSPPTGPVDIGWHVTVGGALEASTAAYTAVNFSAYMDSLEVVNQPIWSAHADLTGGSLAAYKIFANAEFGGWTRDDWIEVAPEFVGDRGVRYSILRGIDLESAAHISIGEEITLTWTIQAIARSGSYALADADFLDTIEVTPVSQTPGIRFVAVPDIGNGNQPPHADAGSDETVAADASCMASVVLDGSGSGDPDGDPLSYEWTGPFGTASGVNPTVSLPLGTHAILLAVDDGKGGSDTDSVTITVADETAPVFDTLTASPGVLWPPNHKMVPIGIEVGASDNCGETTTALTSVSMNEGDEVDTFDPGFDSTQGDGNTVEDIQVDGAGDGSVSLRAERSGTGDGRIYTIYYTATDAAGNTASASTPVTVPHDQP